jgi:hypothetical protein
MHVMRMGIGVALFVFSVGLAEAADVKVPLWGQEAAKWIEGGREFYVSPEGKAQNDGSKTAPWDLRSTLEGKHALKGGDVVWVTAGTYKGCFTATLTGAEGKPIVIRSVPGQTAILDGTLGGSKYVLEISDKTSWCVFWGLEVMVSDPSDIDEKRPSGYWFNGSNSKMINCRVHDASCCGFWSPAVNSEIYGCLIYNIGGQRKGRGQGNGHNMYTQNREGTKRERDNIIFNGFRNGIDVYTTNGTIDGYDIIGNTVFGASACANEGDKKMDIVVGGKKPASRILVKENLAWANGMGRSICLGYDTNGHKDVKIVDNYVAGRLDIGDWAKIEMTGNKVFGRVTGIDPAQFPDNAFGPAPKETVVFVRPNEYEPGRANITIYNWAGADAVAVDISKAVPVGAQFEIRNAQNWNKGPVAKGVHDGKPVSLPMTGMDPVQPIGAEGYITREEMTGKAFNVFVVESKTPDGKP